MLMLSSVLFSWTLVSSGIHRHVWDKFVADKNSTFKNCKNSNHQSEEIHWAKDFDAWRYVFWESSSNGLSLSNLTLKAVPDLVLKWVWSKNNSKLLEQKIDYGKQLFSGKILITNNSRLQCNHMRYCILLDGNTEDQSNSI